MDPAAHRLSITRILNDKNFNAYGRKQAAWNYIIEQENRVGSRFIRTKDGGLFMLIGSSRDIAPISKRGGDRITSYLYNMYGIADHDAYGKAIYKFLHAHAYENATIVELRRFSAFVSKSRTAYLSAYNGKMWKISGDKDPELISNGEDEIFFADDDGGLPTQSDVGPHDILFKQLTDLNYSKSGMSGITPQQQAMALMIWVFALAFPDMMPTKPLLILEGAAGSGKSAGIQLIQLALMGDIRPIIIQKHHEDDFGVLLLRAPIAIFDNTDSYIEWVADAVCSYTTLGKFIKRKLYSDDEQVIIKPHAFIAVASKNPTSFRREDVADRCVILRLDRRTGFKRMGKLCEQINSLRPRLVGEYLWYVNRIIEEIRSGAMDESDENETSRMADFATFSRVVARVMNWKPEAIDELMDVLQRERDAFVNEGDPLVELLRKWVAYRPRFGPANVGREVALQALFLELETLADASGIQFYKTPNTLAQKLRSPHVSRDFTIEMDATGGHKTYRIYRKTDPRLEVIDGGLTFDESAETLTEEEDPIGPDLEPKTNEK